MVVNTDKLGQDGAHWLALYVSGPSKVEYFDSLARKTIVTDIRKYLRRFKECNKNYVPLQPLNSEACGYYCVYFLLERCRGVRFDKIVHKIRKTQNRDRFVMAQIRQYFGL